ncbi:MAG: LysR family transcriptional regulator [Lachnospiraceae bacterium]
MDITYDYYRIFYYVAKYKSFTRAASILMNNQPNISRSINNLEKQLGCTLFVRSNRGVTLTPEGKKLYNHVSVAFRQLQTAELELSGSNTLESGTVTISASETALHGILLTVLKDFHNDYPGIHIHILSHTTPQAIQSVRNGLADFCVVTTPTRVKKPFKETRIKEFHEVLVSSKKYAHLAEKKHHLSDLQKYPMVCLGKDSMTYNYFTELFLKYNIALDPEVEVATSDQLIPIIMHDLGIGFVPDFLTEEPLKNEVIMEIPLYEKLPPRYICLVEDAGHPLSAAAARLKNMLLATQQ